MKQGQRIVKETRDLKRRSENRKQKEERKGGEETANDDEPRREKGNDKRREMIDHTANSLCVSLSQHLSSRHSVQQSTTQVRGRTAVTCLIYFSFQRPKQIYGTQLRYFQQKKLLQSSSSRSRSSRSSRSRSTFYRVKSLNWVTKRILENISIYHSCHQETFLVPFIIKINGDMNSKHLNSYVLQYLQA